MTFADRFRDGPPVVVTPAPHRRAAPGRPSRDLDALAAYYLHRIAGLTLLETARVMHCSRSAVCTHLLRAAELAPHPAGT